MGHIQNEIPKNRMAVISQFVEYLQKGEGLYEIRKLGDFILPRLVVECGKNHDREIKKET